MYRSAIEKLKKWKDSYFRKPMIIEGARQVGKTWLMKEFGKECYKKTVYINFDSNKQMKNLFSSDLNIERIIIGLEIYSDTTITPDDTLIIFDEVQEVPAALSSLKYFYEDTTITPDDTLIIFDEVQEVPAALSSLKYFYENAPQYHIICAGSLLGIALHEGTSFPVGKVDFLKLYPLSFDEFLLGTGYEKLYKLLNSGDYALINSFSEQFIYLLKQYYFIGGMPEVVLRFSHNKDFNEVREVQKRILEAYEQVFSRHAPSDIVPKIRMVWNSIPSQLAKENKKFIYGLVREGGRAKEFETAIMWLCDCGLVHKVSRITTPNLPLKAYEDLKAFKLFLLDVGLLCCMSGISKSVLLDDGEKVIPLEVKAEENLKAKSLKTYREKFKPTRSIRASMANYRKEDDGLVNMPLYMMITLK